MLSGFPSSLCLIADTKHTSDLQSQQAWFSGKKQAGSSAFPIFVPEYSLKTLLFTAKAKTEDFR